MSFGVKTKEESKIWIRETASMRRTLYISASLKIERAMSKPWEGNKLPVVSGLGRRSEASDGYDI